MGLSESKNLLLGQTSSSCSSKGALLLVAAANGDLQVAQEILRTNPKAALYYNFKDRSSPLIQAAARGHFELVQLLLETAVMSEGPERAKRHCIDHANIKRQTALMVACKHGHPDCVEYLVTNGADPLLTDERRHNTCLHFAALYGHSECVHKLLSCRAGAGFRGQGDVQVPVARIPCINDVDGSQVQFVDGHNGWGLTALHIAVFQGSVNTVKVLLRHGASLEVVIAPPRVENSPIRCAAGSNALHIAALIGNISMAKLVLEAQEAFPGLELRAHVDSLGMRPQEYAQRARSPVLLHLLDERLPVHLLRQIWLNYSLDSGLPARHHTLASMLQKLKLMFNLEVIAIQRQLTLMDASCGEHGAQQQQQQQQQAAAVVPGSPAQGHTEAGQADEEGPPSCDSQVEVDRALQELLDEEHRTGAQGRPGAAAVSAPRRASSPGLSQQQQAQQQQQQSAEAAAAVAAARQQWVSQMASIEGLLATIARLHAALQGMNSREAAAAAAAASHGVGWPPSPSPAHEAILDFILSTLITPRTVSAVLHAAKKLVSASMMHVSSSTGALNAAGSAGCATDAPPNDSETQHSMALLTTALRAVETCLHASSQLTAPALVDKADRAAAAAVAGGAVPPATGAAASAAAAAAVGLPPRIGSGSTVSTAAASGALPVLVQQAVAGTGAAREQPELRDGATPGAAADNSNMDRQADARAPATPHPQQQQQQQQGAAAGAGSMTADDTQLDPLSPPSSHWSSHLHTLIAQLQWDIGVQRHRRRRAHAAASAARTAATVVSAAPPPAGGTPVPAVPADSPEAVAALAASQSRVLQPSHPGTLFLAPPASPTLGHPPPTSVLLHPRSPSPTAAAAAAAGNLGGVPELLHREGADEGGMPAAGVQAGGVGAADGGGHEGRRALSLARRSPPPQHTPGSSGTASQATHQALLHPSLQRSPSAAAAAAAAAGELGSRQGRARGVQPLEAVLGADTFSCGQACSGLTSPALPDTHARPLEVSPLATELAAQLSQESASVQDSRFTGAAASAAACMPQLKSSGATPGPQGGRGVTGCQEHTGSLVLRQALQQRELDVTDTAAHKAGLATASECEDDEDDGSSIDSEDDEERGMCPICMDTPISVVVSSCQHGLCVQCAFQLTVKGRELPSCPFCRQKIGGFDWTVSPLESPSANKRKTPTPKKA